MEPRKWLESFSVIDIYQRRTMFVKELARLFNMDVSEAERIVEEYLEEKKHVLEALKQKLQTQPVQKATNTVDMGRHLRFADMKLAFKKPVRDAEERELTVFPTTSVVKVIQLTPISLIYIYLMKYKSRDEVRKIMYNIYVNAMRRNRLKLLVKPGSPVKEVLALVKDFVEDVEDFKKFYVKYYRRLIMI